MKKRVLSFAIAVCMIFGCAAVLPEGVIDDFVSTFASAKESTENEEIHSYKEVQYHVETLDVNRGFSFTYNDDMFNVDSQKESTDLAKMSVGLAMAAYEKNEINKVLEINKDQSNMGFSKNNIKNYNYEESMLSNYDHQDFVAFSIAHKITTFNNEKYNIVIVPIRGTHGDVEWFSDFNLGHGDDHKGFKLAADEVCDKLESVLKTITNKSIDSDHTILLTTGHSRGAAVANIVAGRFSTASRYTKNYVKPNHVFAYTFACPSVSINADTSLKTFTTTTIVEM